jgi:hypothetical protein
VNRSRITSLTQSFTVIHGGGEIDQGLSLELVEAVSAWTAAAEGGVTRLVDVWAAPWNRLAFGCVGTGTAFGGLACTMYLAAADDLVARVKARGVSVRHRQARQSAVDDAEFRALSAGWPLRYI